jgi:hypothetical protein
MMEAGFLDGLTPSARQVYERFLDVYGPFITAAAEAEAEGAADDDDADKPVEQRPRL